MDLNFAEAAATDLRRQPADTILEVRVARTMHEIEQFHDLWSSWTSSRDADAEYCREFVWSSRDFVRPHMIVIFRGTIPEAMFVGRIERIKIESRVGYIRFRGPESLVLIFPSVGRLGNSSSEEISEAFLRSVMSSLRAGEADAALLQQVDMTSRLFEAGLRIPGPTSRDRVLKPAAHYFLRLPRSIEEVHRGFSQGLRAEVRRKKKKLLTDFPDAVKVECFRAPDELERVLPELEKIAAKTYQRALGVGFQDNDEMRRRLRFFAQRGWLRIYLLTIEDKPWAFWTGTLYRDSFSSGDIGFDPGFSRYSPGTFLLSWVIEDLCAAGVAEIDFGSGDAEYKERFGNLRLMETGVYVFAPTVKGATVNLLRTAIGFVDSGLRAFLHHSNLLPRIKRLWRSRLAGHTDGKRRAPTGEGAS